jgi:shikimate 5-dehydrogenase
MMRKSYYSSTYYVINSTVTGTSNGEITLSITSSNTALLTPGRYVYDLIINGANTVNRVVEGIATVLPSVTR